MKPSATILLSLFSLGILLASLLLSTGTAAAATSTVQVGDLFFCGESFSGGVCPTTITAGDTVVWDFSAADVAHTVTECGASCDTPTRSPVFDSGLVQNHGTFQFIFTTAGTYNYLCQVHAFEMRGRVIVQAAAPTPSGGSSSTPAAGTTPTSTSGGGTLPTTGYGPQAHSSSQWWTFAALAIAGATLVSFGVLSFARAKRRLE